MISLSQPAALDHLTFTEIRFDPVKGEVSGQLQISSTNAPDLRPVAGTFRVSPDAAQLDVSAPIEWHRSIPLTAPQATVLKNFITSTQSTLQSALITLALVAGTQRSQ